MKRLLLFLIPVLTFSLSFGQISSVIKDADFSAFLMNYETPFHGTISDSETVIKLRVEKATKNPQKPEQYFVSGYSEVEEGNKTDFSGEITLTQKYNVKDLPDEMLVFGDFILKEQKSGEHSGVFTGKVRIQAPKVITKESRAGITCRGQWKSYSGNLDYEVWWANFVPKDISKVIFK